MKHSTYVNYEGSMSELVEEIGIFAMTLWLILTNVIGQNRKGSNADNYISEHTLRMRLDMASDKQQQSYGDIQKSLGKSVNPRCDLEFIELTYRKHCCPML